MTVEQIACNIEQTAEGWWVIKGDTLSSRIMQAKSLDADPVFTAAICKYIDVGSIVIDVGANIGDHTITYLNTVGAHGIVMAYEPHPISFACLCRNCPTAIKFPYALGRIIKDDYLFLFDGHDSGSSRISGTSDHFPIKVSTIDADLPDHSWFKTVSLIKIDCEGCEPEVLTGAQRTISNHHPVLVIEVFEELLNKRGNKATDIYAFLDKHGYSVTQTFGASTIRTDIICEYTS